MDTGRAVSGRDGTGLDGPGAEGHYRSFHSLYGKRFSECIISVVP